MKKIKLGLDIGFGAVKVVRESGKGRTGYFKFPTAVAHVSAGVGDLGGFANGSEFTFGGRPYAVGESAMATAMATENFDFMKAYSPLLTFKALKDVGVAVDGVAVGLPLAYYTRQNAESIAGVLRSFKVNGETVELSVSVYPQAVGVLMDYLLGGDGVKGANGLVVDIGFNTVDVLPFVAGKPVRANTAMLERSGITMPAGQVRQEIQRRDGLRLTLPEACRVLADGAYVYYGERKDATRVVSEAVKNYVEWLLREIESRWEPTLQRADRLILAGGGAYLVREHIPAKYRSLVHIPDEPEFANARGYLKIEKEKEAVK